MAPRRNAGFSFVEIMIAMFAFAIIGLGIAGMQTPVEKAIGLDTVRFDARTRATRALEQVARQVRSASLSSLQTLPTGFQTLQPVVAGTAMDDLQFESYAYDADDPDGLAVPGGTYNLQLVAATEDPTNGLDDDKDGVVDGYDLVYTPDGQPAARLLKNVTACQMTLQDRTLRLSVSVQLRAPGGQLLTESATAAVEIRND